ncbi:hypothetical protein H311_03130 [Anncaliia algerae PRA109]|nr:hypothetical protein H311_03130 [Anncaliia algerae PRA109]
MHIINYLIINLISADIVSESNNQFNKTKNKENTMIYNILKQSSLKSNNKNKNISSNEFFKMKASLNRGNLRKLDDKVITKEETDLIMEYIEGSEKKKNNSSSINEIKIESSKEEKNSSSHKSSERWFKNNFHSSKNQKLASNFNLFGLTNNENEPYEKKYGWELSFYKNESTKAPSKYEYNVVNKNDGSFLKTTQSYEILKLYDDEDESDSEYQKEDCNLYYDINNFDSEPQE